MAVSYGVGALLLQIFQLSVGNHERFNKRREPDSMETQQMKAQAAEEQLLRQAERERLLKETEARLEAEKEREELERRLQHYEGMLRQASDTLVSLRGGVTGSETCSVNGEGWWGHVV